MAPTLEWRRLAPGFYEAESPKGIIEISRMPYDGGWAITYPGACRPDDWATLLHIAKKDAERWAAE